MKKETEDAFAQPYLLHTSITMDITVFSEN